MKGEICGSWKPAITGWTSPYQLCRKDVPRVPADWQRGYWGQVVCQGLSDWPLEQRPDPIHQTWFPLMLQSRRHQRQSISHPLRKRLCRAHECLRTRVSGESRRISAATFLTLESTPKPKLDQSKYPEVETNQCWYQRASQWQLCISSHS